MTVDIKKFLDTLDHTRFYNSMAAPKPVHKTDMAQYLLAHSFGGGKTIGASVANSVNQSQGSQSEGPSLLSRIFHEMSQPLMDVGIPIERGIAKGITSPGSFEQKLANEVKSIGSGLLGGIEHAAARNEIPVASPWIQAIVGKGNTGKGKAQLAKDAQRRNPEQTSSDIIGKDLGVKNPVAKYGVGFLADVGMDPLSFVPGPKIGELLQKARKAKLAVQGYRTDEAIQAAAKSGNVSSELDAAAASGSQPNPSLFQKPAPKPKLPPPSILRNVLPKVNPREVPQPFGNITIPQDSTVGQHILNSPQDLAAVKKFKGYQPRTATPQDQADIAAEFVDRMRQGKMAKKGIISDGKGTLSMKGATAALEDVRNGTMPRFGPQMEPATGAAEQIAKDTADKFIKSPSRKLGKGELNPADQANLHNALRAKAAELINKEYDARPVKGLTDKQQKAADGLVTYFKDAKIKPTKEVLAKELAPIKTLNKTDKRAIEKYFFPAEKIQNYAATKFGREKANALANQMLRTAEDHLIAQGHHPTYWNGMRARLSDVLAELGPVANKELQTKVMSAFFDKKPTAVTNPDVQAAVTKVLSRRSLAMSDLLDNITQHTAQAKNIVDQYMTHPKAVKLLKSLQDSAKTSVKSMGATSEEANAIADMVRNIIKVDEIGNVNTVMDRLGPELVNAVKQGRTDAETVNKINNAIIKTLDTSHKTAEFSLTGVKAIDSFFLRWSTWAGRQEEVKRISQDAFLYGEQQVANRAKFLRHILKGYKKEEIYAAFNAARSDFVDISNADPRVKDLTKFFKDYFEWMLGSSGFKDIKDFEQTTAVRSSFVMADMNKHMKAIGSNWKFFDTSKAKFPDPIHEGKVIPRDYKKLGWLTSWEWADPKKIGQDPISFLYDVDLAMQRTMAEYNTYDEFAMRFGAKKTDAWFDPKIHQAIVPHARLDGLYFHPQVRDEFLRLVDDMEKGAFHPHSPMMRFIGKMTRMWKSMVTIYYPSHHIRNLIGDGWNTWAAGYNDPRMYTKAAKVLATQKTRYAQALKDPTMDVLKGLIDKQALNINETRPGGRVLIKVGKHQITDENIWAAGFKRGMFLSYNKVEDIFGETPFGHITGTSPRERVLARLSAPFGGRAHHVAAQISEYREHYVRAAHFIGAVEKNLKKGKNLNQAYDDAAHEVRKCHPDGTDLSINEQKLRYVIPFYAWTRKEIPLLIQTMLQRPAKIAAYPKAMYNLQGALGIQAPSMEDPFPDNQLFPYWLRASGIGPIGDPQSDNPVAGFWGKLGATITGFNGQPSGYTIVNPSNPFNDTVTQLFGFGRPSDAAAAMSGNLSPGLNIPMNLMMNRTFSGAPITKDQGGQGIPNFIMQQFPQFNALSRVTGIGAKKKDNVQGQQKQNLINILTALGIHGSGPYINSAQYEARDRAKYNGR